MLKPFTRIISTALVCLLGTMVSSLSTATTVQFQTSLGDFEVILFDQGTPATVDNFLAYVEAGDYTDTIFHRSVANFVVQSGGYSLTEEGTLVPISQRPAVTNEPVYSNIRGTIAMAKLGGNANSATSQWFFNLGNNSANLDVQNGGFTVFGIVKDNGMDIVDDIADLPVFNLGSPLDTIPLVDYTVQDAASGVEITKDNFMRIYAIVVTDGAENTLGSIQPLENTLIHGGEPEGDDSGGGSLPLSLLALLIAAAGYRRKYR